MYMEKHTNEVEDNQMRALSWKTRVSYGLGDTACNVVYGMIGSLLTIFYTDYVGISAAAIGVIMLISRIFDGCSDVIMGFVVNKNTQQIWSIQTMDLMDGDSICSIGSIIIHSTTYCN